MNSVADHAGARVWPGEGVRQVEILGGRADVRVRAGRQLAWAGPDSVEADQDGDTLVLRLPRARAWDWLALAGHELELTLPPSVTALHIRTTGDVDLDGVRADCTIEIRAGDLRARHGRGRWRLKTGAGDVEVDDHQGELDVHSGAGDVDIRGGRLVRARVRSGAGNLHWTAWVEREAEIVTGAGSVDLRPLTGGDADIAVRSGFGNITLDLTGVAGGRLEVQTGAGNIHDGAGIHVGRRGGFGQRAVDVLGPGRGVIRLVTGAGDIRVTGRRPEPPAAAAGPAAAGGAPAGHQVAAPPEEDATTAGSGPDQAGLRAGPVEPVPRTRASQGSAGPSHSGESGAAAGRGTGGDGTAAAGEAGVARYRTARQVLEALARGELDVEDADRLLRRLEGKD